MIQLPGYELIERIHESRRTLVFRGMREADRASVVVKIPASNNPSVMELKRFRREHELGAMFSGNPHVISYYGLELFAGGLALIEEDFGAVSLERLIPSRGYSLKAFLDIAVQLAKGLIEVHRVEIVHKDIKPSNLVMNPKTGQVKYIDFGISSRLAREYQAAETPERLEGTLSYISPEQTGRMNRAMDYRTDFYSLGVTLYHLLSGRVPFRGDDALELVHCHIAKEPEPLHLVKPDIPEVISQIVAKLMAKDVELRYQSGAGLLSDLEHCRNRLVQDLPLDLFEPGRNDVKEHFFLSQKLYGRDLERDELLRNFEVVVAGEMRCLLVSGYAGIGKSSLIGELYKPATASRAYFLNGKYDRLDRDVPYGAIAEAFRALIERIMSEPNEVVARWRARMLAAMGINGRVLLDVLPDLEMLLGDCPPLEPLGPVESRNRFHSVFLACLELLANKEHPLVLFLDDLQWADPASLDLIERLIREGRPKYFLLLCAYRDNEVDEHHLLEVALNNLARGGVNVPHLRLGPLETGHLAELIADSLGCDLEVAVPLAGVVRAKTNGNPFFSNEWLKLLHQHRHLMFDHDRSMWTWNTEKIAELDVAANVVDFLIGSLKQLPPGTGEVLRAAACLGTRFDLDTLAHTVRQETLDTARHLWPALRWGLVVPLNQNYRLMDPAFGNETDPTVVVSYRFQHDRVQQAAYVMLPADQARLYHLDIGRRLNRARERGEPVPVMDVLSHLNLARSLIGDRDELQALAALNLDAGRKALTSVAYKMARNYLDTALECMSGDMWHDHYQLSFDVHYHRAQAAFFSGDMAMAERLCQELISCAGTAVEKARVLEIRMAQYTTKGDMEGAIHTGLEGLAMLGLQLPSQVGRLRISYEYFRVMRMLSGRDISLLHEGEELTEPRVRAALNLLMRIALPSFLTGNLNLYCLVALSRMRLCLQYGNSPEAAAAYATFALYLGSFRGDYGRAETFGRLALRLDERYRYLPLRCKVLFIYGLTVYPWSNNWQGISNYLKQVVELGRQSGDFLFAAMAGSQVHQWDPTMDLETAFQESRKYLSMIREMGNREMELLANIYQQMRLNLMGRTMHRLSLSNARFKEESLDLELFKGTSMMTSYHIVRLQLFFLYGAYDKAETEAEDVIPHLDTVLGWPISLEYHFYHFLTLSAQARRAGSSAGTKRKMMACYRHVQRRAAHCPKNFEHRRLLMKAELLGLAGRESKALDFYQNAQEMARERGYQAHAALSSELAGSFLLHKGRARLASVCFREAADVYGRWGAFAKVAQLRAHYPDLFPIQEEHRPVVSAEATTTAAGVTSLSSEFGEHSLDLNSVIKSSLAISSEIEYRSLVSKMMDIVIEAAGARKAVLVRVYDNLHKVEAVATLDAPAYEVIRAEMLDACRDLSARVVRFCLRTGQVVVVANASADRNFSRDPYISEGNVKSILCLPIRHKDQVNGVLYLENNLAEGIFSTDRVSLLRLLVAQASISLENARLLADSRRAESEVRKLNRELEALNEQLEQKVRDRTEELKDVQKELLEKAHQAGMAEVATSVLHNVGNILNSVITSCQLIHNTVEGTRMAGLLRANELLRENMDRLDTFVRDDPKGVGLMKYYLGLEEPFQRERGLLLENTSRLLGKVDSIRNVIMAQQSYATSGFQNEALSLQNVVDDALGMLAGSIDRAGVVVEKTYLPVPHLFLPRNKLIHLFINLIKNALEAMAEIEQGCGLLKICIGEEGSDLCILFEDTGMGIEVEHLDHIFQHGYTTKLKGHGFGLHSVANTMTEMGGTISVHSDGLGKGAAFKLFFPLQNRAELLD